MSGSNPSSPRALVKFGKYTLLKKLGAGGMAEAFLAQFDGASGFLKTCVVKRMLPHLAQDEQFVRMFHAEAKVAAMLTHTNVVQIFDMGEIEGTHYIAMEFVDGAPLHLLARTAWKRQRSVPLEVVCCAMADAALGLAAAHDLADDDGKPLGVIHRDISPDNLMINREGVTKVLDFGVAKQLGNEQTAAGELRGKIPFLAPEQLLGKKLDKRADLYALGVTFYWLVTGKRPFTAENEHALMHLIVKTECEPPITFNPAIPDRINDLIVQLMSKDPNQRPPDGFAVHDLLSEALVARRALVVPFVREMLTGDLAVNNDVTFHTPGFVPSTPHTQSLKDAWGKKAAVKEPPWAAAVKASAKVEAQLLKPNLSASTDLDDPTVAAPYNTGNDPPGRIELNDMAGPRTNVSNEASAAGDPMTTRIEISAEDLMNLTSPSMVAEAVQSATNTDGAHGDEFDERTRNAGIGINIGDASMIRDDEGTQLRDPVKLDDGPITGPSPRPDLTGAYPQPPEVDTLRNVNELLESSADPSVGMNGMPATDPGERALRGGDEQQPFDPFADLGASSPERPFDRGGGETLPPTPGVVRPQPALNDVLNSNAVRALDGPSKRKEPLPYVPIAAGLAILAVCALLYVVTRDSDPPTPAPVVVAPLDDKPVGDAPVGDAPVGDKKLDDKKKVDEQQQKLDEQQKKLDAQKKLDEPKKLEAQKKLDDEKREEQKKRDDQKRDNRREQRREERREEKVAEVSGKAPSDIQWQLGGKTIGRGNATLKLPPDANTVIAYDSKRGGRSNVPVVNGVADYGAMPHGKIHPRASPFADVFLGKEAFGTTPFAAIDVVAGRYTLRFVHEGKEETRTVDVGGGETEKVAVDFGG